MTKYALGGIIPNPDDMKRWPLPATECLIAPRDGDLVCVRPDHTHPEPWATKAQIELRLTELKQANPTPRSTP